MMQGTPYVYQGEELGMTNTVFHSVNDFRDLQSINAYHELTEKGVISAEELFPKICHMSRDNARTPMQWDDSENAGFTTGTPWIAVNPNYTEINAKEQVGREDSVFNYYKKLIALRKKYEIIVYGDYNLLFPEDEELFVYERSLEGKKLLVVCNFSENEREFDFSIVRDGQILINNYKDFNMENNKLRAFETAVILY